MRVKQVLRKGGNRMKKGMITLAVLAAVIVAGTSLYARGRGGSGPVPDGRSCFGGTGYMQQELNLTQDQQDKIFKINQDFRQKMYDNRKDYIKCAELRVEKLKAIDAVLTKEQKEKLASLHAKRGAGRGCRRG
jgi:Spy/CpxP family protein refolding chaperone